MEIIARRKNGVLVLYSIMSILGLIVFVASAGLSGSSSSEAENRWIAGLILMVVGGIICISVLRTPKIIIQYDGEHLILREGKFKINELGRVNYRRAHARGFHYSWGKIILALGGQEIVYNNVADVEQVHNRLMELRLQAEKNSK